MGGGRPEKQESGKGWEAAAGWEARGVSRGQKNMRLGTRVEARKKGGWKEVGGWVK